MVYRGSGPALVGSYFFIDFGSDRFWTLKVVNGHAVGVADRSAQLFSPTAPISGISTFGTDGHGNLYMIGLGGDIFRINATAFAGDHGDNLHGSAGNDRLYGGPGSDNLFGDANRDFLSGGFGDDHLFGGPGGDVLRGGPGADVLRGGPGNDAYIFPTAGDHIVEASNGGRDVVQAAVSFVLPDNVEVLRLVGGNPLVGTGNGGHNVLIGNAAANHLTGGGGPDAFVFDARLGHGNVDQIVDYAPGVDVIRLENTIFHLHQGPLAPRAFFAGPVAHDADDRIIYDQSTGALIYDANGSQPGGEVQFATVVNYAALTSADFFVF